MLHGLRRPPQVVWLTLAVLVSSGGLWLLFLQQMKHSAGFANWVGSWSPTLAERFACACPLCAGLISASGASCPGTEDGSNRYLAWDALEQLPELNPPTVR